MEQYTYPDILFTSDSWLIITEGMAPNKAEKEFISTCKVSPEKALAELGTAEVFSSDSRELSFLYRFASGFYHYIARELPGDENSFGYPEQSESSALIKEAAQLSGGRNITHNWMKALGIKMFFILYSEISVAKETVCEYLIKRKPDLNFRGKIYFNIVENPQGRLPFAFSANVYTPRDGKMLRTSLKSAIQKACKEGNLYPYVMPLKNASAKSIIISGMEESGALFSDIGLTAEQALAMLKETPLYRECGIICRVPAWWKKADKKPKLTLTVGEHSPTVLGMAALTDFSVDMELEGKKLTDADIELMATASDRLLKINGNWIEAKGNEYTELINVFRAAKKLFEKRKCSFAEAMRLCIGMYDRDLAPLMQTDPEINQGKWLTDISEKLLNKTYIKATPLSTTLKAKLRPYQTEGFNWLCYINKIGFGACLSDDMGLGKTVELLAFLDRLREDGKRPSLLIIPASLTENWRKEAKKFAPELKVRILHRSYDGNDIPDDDTDLYITTYAMAAKNTALTEREWVTLTLDEAQAIKNPTAKQTKAVKAIPSKMRIVMTGTPIENSLTDLWSLFDFINPGMLGSSSQFSSYAKAVRKEDGGSKLRRITAPFILRRLKTDKRIIPDLPDKIEMNSYPSLTKKQSLMYKACVDTLATRLKTEADTGIERKGLILTALLRLKQICDHPSLYDGSNDYQPSDSGKFRAVAELCETIREQREKLLVFTQFAELCAPLNSFLANEFGADGFTVTGNTPLKLRGEYTDRFNSDEYIPFTVLSLKAGGVGLNLTGANHVIHFDRWWNPSVENQATDRAFRIGQRKNVIVHKLITRGTVEEKIDMLIEEKKALADDILFASSAESIITQMSSEELLALLRQEHGA